MSESSPGLLHSVVLLQDYGCPTAVETALANPQLSPSEWDERLAEIATLGIEECGVALSLIPDIIQPEYQQALTPEMCGIVSNASRHIAEIRRNNSWAYANEIVQDEEQKAKSFQRLGRQLLATHATETQDGILERLSILATDLTTKYDDLLEQYRGTPHHLERLGDEQLGELNKRVMQLDRSSEDYKACLEYLYDNANKQGRVRELALQHGLYARLIDDEVIIDNIERLQALNIGESYAVSRLLALHQSEQVSDEIIDQILQKYPLYFYHGYPARILRKSGLLDEDAIQDVVGRLHILNVHRGSRIKSLSQAFNQEQPVQVSADQETANKEILTLMTDMHLVLSPDSMLAAIEKHPSVHNITPSTLLVRLRAIKKTFGAQLATLILEDHFAYIAADSVSLVNMVISELPVGKERQAALRRNATLGHAALAHERSRSEGADLRVAAFDSNPEEQLRAASIEAELKRFGVNVAVRELLSTYPQFLDYDNIPRLQVRAQALTDIVGVEEATRLIGLHPNYLLIQRPVQALGDHISSSNAKELRRLLQRILNNLPAWQKRHGINTEQQMAS